MCPPTIHFLTFPALSESFTGNVPRVKRVPQERLRQDQAKSRFNVLTLVKTGDNNRDHISLFQPHRQPVEGDSEEYRIYYSW